MSKRAVILCGGKGTRLRPYTWVLPKPLMPLGNTPILELIIKQLKSNGFAHITLAVSHQAEIMKAFFGDGSKWDIKIDYSYEPKPLSTMGPLKLIHDLPENFLVMNGDVLTDLNYGSFFEFHETANNIFTISAFTREHVNDYGVLESDASGRLTHFREKPTTRFTVSMGIYVASSRILDVIPADTFYGFDHLMLDLIKRKTPATIKEHSGYWLDIGRPDDYQLAIENFEKDPSQFLQ